MEQQSSAGLGDGLGLVRELQQFFAYGDEEPNVAASQLPKLQLQIADRFAGDPKAGNQKVACRVVHVHERQPSILKLSQNTRGVWKVSDFNACHQIPLPPVVRDDGDDI